MVDAPEGFFDELHDAGLDIVSFHLEAVPEPGAGDREGASARAMRVGMTLNLETPVEARLPVPGRNRRRDAHEHPTGVVRTR